MHRAGVVAARCRHTMRASTYTRTTLTLISDYQKQLKTGTLGACISAPFMPILVFLSIFGFELLVK